MTLAEGEENVAMASFPGLGGANPYLDLFYKALASNGIDHGGEFSLVGHWLAAENGAGLQAVHLNWPEVLWREYRLRFPQRLRSWVRRRVPGAWRLLDWPNRSEERDSHGVGLVNSLAGVLYLNYLLARLRGRGVRVVWTLHNLEPHEKAGWLDRLGYRQLAQRSDLVIVHDRRTRDAFLRRFHVDTEVVVMPHGNYDGAYPRPRDRGLVLRELGLSSERPVVACLGALRNYKGLDVACEAVASLNGEVQFLCAGSPHASFDVAALEKRMQVIPNSVLAAKRLSSQEFADYAGASDLILLPYSKVTGSGALLAALTFSRPVVATDLPYFRDILEGEEEAGILVKKGDVAALAKAVRRMLAVKREAREAAARRLADRFDWRRTVQPVVQVIRGWER